MSGSTYQHHFEVVVETNARTGHLAIYLNDENSATWHEGTVYHVDGEVWEEDPFDPLSGYATKTIDGILKHVNAIIKEEEDRVRSRQ